MRTFNKIAVTFIALFLMVFAVDMSAKDIKKVEIKTPTVQCDMCKKTIEKALNKLDGVISSDVDFEKKVTTVEYDAEQIELDDIREEISDVGYDADKVKKDKRAYKRLHNCCKLPEDQK